MDSKCIGYNWMDPRNQYLGQRDAYWMNASGSFSITSDSVTTISDAEKAVGLFIHLSDWRYFTILLLEIEEESLSLTGDPWVNLLRIYRIVWICNRSDYYNFGYCGNYLSLDRRDEIDSIFIFFNGTSHHLSSSASRSLVSLQSGHGHLQFFLFACRVCLWQKLSALITVVDVFARLTFDLAWNKSINFRHFNTLCWRTYFISRLLALIPDIRPRKKWDFFVCGEKKKPKRQQNILFGVSWTTLRKRKGVNAERPLLFRNSQFRMIFSLPISFRYVPDDPRNGKNQEERDTLRNEEKDL